MRKPTAFSDPQYRASPVQDTTTHVFNVGSFRVSQVTSWSACIYRRYEKPIWDENTSAPADHWMKVHSSRYVDRIVSSGGWIRDEAIRDARVSDVSTHYMRA